MELNYENHLKRAIDAFGDDYAEISNAGARCVVLLRSNHLSYKQIQLWMGNPSKKWIREILQQYAPNLIELDCNHSKLEAKYTPLEKGIRSRVKGETIVEVDDEDWTLLWKDEDLIIEDPMGFSCNITVLDELTKKKILIQLENDKNNV